MSIENLDHLELLKISGDDARDFLQGQLTNDVALPDNNWQLSGYCNPKGRLIALLYLWRGGGDYFALLDQSLLESVKKRLSMYVLRSKVTITHEIQVRVIGLIESDTWPAELEATKEQLQQIQPGEVVTNNFGHTLKFNQRYLMVLNDDTNIELPAGADNHRWLSTDIEEGIPQIDANTTEQFVPQMVNLDLLNGISFKKGCYTGQEIVARMHYLGKLKQRLFTCSIETNSEDIQSGDPVYADGDTKTKTGTVISANPISKQLLAVLRLADVNSPLSLQNGTTVNVNQNQPYEIK